MAESYQANLDGTITKPNLFNDDKDYNVKDKFESFLRYKNWEFDEINSENGSFYRYKLENGNKQLIINIYLKQLGYRGRKLNEKGIQFSAGLPLKEKSEKYKKNNELFIYFALYKHYLEDDFLICAWKPEEWSMSGSSLNCFIDTNTLAEAFLWGKAVDKKRLPKSIFAFQPAFLYDYLNNMESYHNNENIIAQKQDIIISDKIASNIIYFGSPGTGKSHKVNEITNDKNVTQITFHPEYDYNSFVGGYKPTMNDKNEIEYSFVPQAFTNIYIKAWKNHESDDITEHFYLQIEEINRGNCAEIFGDLFQLLDRDTDGYSKYKVNVNKELNDYLKKEFTHDEHKGLVDSKIQLPNNLTIIATMNTSDQSLFPMDSAFKRRWDWKYIKIDYECLKSDFIISLNIQEEYSWLKFLFNVNKKILEATQNQDKQIGNWFIIPKDKNKIVEEDFINKVIFYLWNDVFKDEEETIFIKDKNMIQYEDFFTNNDNSKLIKYLLEERLNLKPIIQNEKTTEDNLN